MTLPANLPSIANAKLPQTYERAKATLAECTRLDECRDWANKADALASYAKQSDDDELMNMAMRIKARAIRRCGELLRQIPPAKNQHVGASAGAPTSRNAAARDAGMSLGQKHTALRVANVPESEFEAAVSRKEPATVTALAAQGRQQSTSHLRGRDPKEFARATEAQGYLRRLAEFVASMDPAMIARASLPHERRPMQERIGAIQPWLGALDLLLEEAKGNP